MKQKLVNHTHMHWQPEFALVILPSVREKRTLSLSRVLLPHTTSCLESTEPSEALKLMRSDQLEK